MIIINDIKFTPRPDCTYKYDYVDLATIIATPSRWGEKIPAEYLDKAIHPEVDTGWVARAIWRQVILNDLWFIMYFILGIPDSICNTPFVLKQCRVVEDGPVTDTLDVWARGHSKSPILTKAETIQYHLRFPDHCTIIFSFTHPTAEAFVKSIKEAYEMSFLISCFPDVLYQKHK